MTQRPITVMPIPTTKRSNWGEPVPLPTTLFPVPPFDPDLLPTVLRPWILDISNRMQCPPDYPAVAAIVALASLIGRQIMIRPKRKDDWAVVPNLWGTIIGRPGVLKTPAVQEPLKMLERLDRQARGEFEEANRCFEAEQLVHKAAGKQAEQDIQKAVKSGDADKASRIARELIGKDEETPRRRRYLTSDTTVEKLGELLSENPRGILVFRDELVGWLSSLDKEGREGSRQFFLEAWNGDGRFTFDRIGRGTVEIEAACVSVFGSIQPGPLSDYLRKARGLSDDGLLQRLQLAVWPDIGGKWKNVDQWPDTEAKQGVWETCQRINTLNPSHYNAEFEDQGPPSVRFATDAQGEFNAWREELEMRLRSDELEPALESHLAKYRSLVPSLALLFHIIDSVEGSVSRTALRRAIDWSEYLESHARRIYGQLIAPELAAAHELDRHLVSGDLSDGFTARDVYLKGWRGLSSDSVPAALAVLEDHQRVSRNEIETGGRPKVSYNINPAIYDPKISAGNGREPTKPTEPTFVGSEGSSGEASKVSSTDRASCPRCDGFGCNHCDEQKERF